MLAVDLLTRLGLATVLGVAIGFDRQLRSRLAGMAVVSVGSALVVILSAYSLDQDGDRLSVVAHIVSGVGLLGAVVIFKQSVSATGMTTAATLWATAAVGALAGAGLWQAAIAGAVFTVAVVRVVQPLGSRMDQVPAWAGRDRAPAEYTLQVVCAARVQADVKTLVARAMPSPQFQLRAVHVSPAPTNKVELRADYVTADRNDLIAENAVSELSRRPEVTSVQWSSRGLF